MEHKRLKPLDFGAEPMSIEVGPSHPAMHGITRFTMKLDGEVILGMDAESLERLTNSVGHYAAHYYRDFLNTMSEYDQGDREQLIKKNTSSMDNRIKKAIRKLEFAPVITKTVIFEFRSIPEGPQMGPDRHQDAQNSFFDNP